MRKHPVLFKIRRIPPSAYRWCLLRYRSGPHWSWRIRRRCRMPSKAINEGALLTSLDSVRQKYGFTDKMLFTGIDANGEEYQYVYICFSNNACTIIARSGEVIEL